MTRWRKLNHLWCAWPSNPIGLVEMIGGSYISASPHISYKRLLESLYSKGFAIHTWPYIPGFDHQTQANQAWKSFRHTREKLELRVSSQLRTIRIGHSLGCKLHLLAPDGGRKSNALINISFNNFNINRSIPMIGKLAAKMNIKTEFSPSPKETINIIYSQYQQKNNLIIRFKNDELDQSSGLISCLKMRKEDSSKELLLEGNHLTPVSTGLSNNILGNSISSSYRERNLKMLINEIYIYSKLNL